MTKWKNILLFYFIIISSAWVACKKERDPCLQPTTIPLRIGFYQPADTGSLGRDSVLANAIYALVDTTVYFQTKSTSKFSMFLSSRADSCRWIIIPDSAQIINPQRRDTLVFYYERQLHFLSEACGFTYFYQLKRINATNYLIDSVIINKYEVTTDANIEHIKIFY